jgi:2-polyprenyl-3-methyl-5-hydroxy-6-metoxy-1,4-benzoquinol methylase
MDHFHIVEIGCGLGGPAGDIAKRLLCIVPGIDMTEPFVEAAHRLTGLKRR